VGAGAGLACAEQLITGTPSSVSCMIPVSLENIGLAARKWRIRPLTRPHFVSSKIH
jgi:hypothetical protein